MEGIQTKRLVFRTEYGKYAGLVMVSSFPLFCLQFYASFLPYTCASFSSRSCHPANSTNACVVLSMLLIHPNSVNQA